MALMGLTAYQTKDGRLYAAIDGEGDRWDLSGRIGSAGGVADLHSLAEGTHDERKIVHQEAPVPPGARPVATLTGDATTLWHREMSDAVHDYFTRGPDESGLCSIAAPMLMSSRGLP